LKNLVNIKEYPDSNFIESFLHAWDKNEDVGKKCMLTNAFYKNNKKEINFLYQFMMIIKQPS
jgi:hypothetical protein